MKKFVSLLLTAVLLATMLTVFAVPASAEEILELYIRDGTYTVNTDITLTTGIFMNGKCTLCIKSSGFLSNNWGPIDFYSSPPDDQKIELEDGGGLYLTFKLQKDAIAFCKLLNDSGISSYINGNAVQAGVCCHQGSNPKVCKLCGETITGGEGSILSEGSLTIICSVACLAVGLVGGLLIGKKKTKTALASGTDNTDEE